MAVVTPDPRPAKRIRDPQAVRDFIVQARACEACGASGVRLSAHHVLGKGGHYKGDDVAANLVALCGDGTTGCHGEFHNGGDEARARIGRAARRRIDVVDYLSGKMGGEAAREFLTRVYRT